MTRKELEEIEKAQGVRLGEGDILVFRTGHHARRLKLGAWSNEHYGPVAQNLWGFGKHLLDLPFKLALPFILWAGFYFQDFQQNLRRS